MPQQLGAYDVYGTLGKGQFCRVRFAVNKTTNFSFAIKMYDKAKLRENGLFEATKNEIAVMKTLDNRHCVGIRDMFASKEKIYLVLDLMMGGSLQNRLKKKVKFTEDRSRHYFQQIVSGMEYCHHMSIIIGGLTLDGILVDGEGGIKISDFGCAVLDTDEASSTPGTPLRRKSVKSCSSYYMAPEMVEHNSSTSRMTDVWTLGIILFAMVAGFMPFDVKPTLPEMLRNISTGLHEPYPEWFSPSLIDLLDRILEVDPAKRCTLHDVVNHDWMQWDSEANFDEQSDIDASDAGGDEPASKAIDSVAAVEENFCGDFINKPLFGLLGTIFSPLGLFSPSSPSPAVPPVSPAPPVAPSGRGPPLGATSPSEKQFADQIMKKLKKHQKDLLRYSSSDMSISERPGDTSPLK